MAVGSPLCLWRHQAAHLLPLASVLWLVWHGHQPGINLTLCWCTGCPLATVTVQKHVWVQTSHLIQVGNRLGLLAGTSLQPCRHIFKASTQRNALLSFSLLFPSFQWSISPRKSDNRNYWVHQQHICHHTAQASQNASLPTGPLKSMAVLNLQIWIEVALHNGSGSIHGDHLPSGCRNAHVVLCRSLLLTGWC